MTDEKSAFLFIDDTVIESLDNVCGEKQGKNPCSDNPTAMSAGAVCRQY